MRLRNAFTVDVEDYYHVSAFEKHIARTNWDDYESRVVANTHRLLQLLDRHHTHATFFVLGWVAERFPHLVREIQASGHEIGSHGSWHSLIYRLTPEQFREDLVRSRDLLQDLTGQPVVAFRAPSFSVTRQSLWALEILAEEGFRFDASIFPIYHDRYGIPDAPEAIHPVETAAGTVWEFPGSVLRLGPVNLPVAGGGYFRLYPLAWTQWCLTQINAKHARPFVFYVHPWEVDPEQPRLRAGSRLDRMRHYVNLKTTERKLDVLLEQFSFGPVSTVIEEAIARHRNALGSDAVSKLLAN